MGWPDGGGNVDLERTEHQLDAGAKRCLVMGFTGTDYVFVKVNASGEVFIANPGGGAGGGQVSVPTVGYIASSTTLFAVVNTGAVGALSVPTIGYLASAATLYFVGHTSLPTLGYLASSATLYVVGHTSLPTLGYLASSTTLFAVTPISIPTVGYLASSATLFAAVNTSTQHPWGSGATTGRLGDLALFYRNDALGITPVAANQQFSPASVDSLGRIRVNPSYSVAESAAHAVGDTLANLISGIRQTSDTNRTDADNETCVFLFNDKQHLRVSVQGTTDHDAVDAGRGIKLGGRARTAEPSAVANNDFVDAYFDEFGYLKVKVGNLSPNVEGDKADDAVDGGNPVKIGGRVFTALRVPLPAADRVNGCFDGWGRVIVHDGSPDDQVMQANTLSTGSTDVGLVAPVSGSLTVVKSVLVSNTSATKVRIDLKDGTSTKISMALAADGGGFAHEYSKGWVLSSGQTLTAQISASVTDVRVNLGYYRKPY